jgi:hypothetical protein
MLNRAWLGHVGGNGKPKKGECVEVGLAIGHPSGLQRGRGSWTGGYGGLLVDP